jgi:hypothetical protein
MGATVLVDTGALPLAAHNALDAVRRWLRSRGGRAAVPAEYRPLADLLLDPDEEAPLPEDADVAEERVLVQSGGLRVSLKK